MPAFATQLRLLPAARPLDERLGADFVRQAPRRPGVYFMRGQSGQLLYVGKAQDLRQRLGSYRSLSHASRKTTRLLHAVRSLTWEVCDSDEAATLRENELLRTHRPRFNRVGTWPQANGFLDLERAGNSIRLGFVREQVVNAANVTGLLNDSGIDKVAADVSRRHPSPAPDAPTDVGGYGDRDFVNGPVLDDAWTEAEQPYAVAPGATPGEGDRQVFGAFKPSALLAYAALLRLLWGNQQDWPLPTTLPRPLLLRRPPMTCWLHGISGGMVGLLADFLAGRSAGLLNVLAGFAEAPGSAFAWQFWRSEWELCSHFYRSGPERNRELRARFGGGDALIGQVELDDLLVRWRHSQ